MVACAQHLSLLRHPKDPIARNIADALLGHWLWEAKCLRTVSITPLRSWAPLAGVKGERSQGLALQLLPQPRPPSLADLAQWGPPLAVNAHGLLSEVIKQGGKSFHGWKTQHLF